MFEKNKQYDDEGRVIRENRSQSKRERQLVKDLAEDLLKLPAHQYEKLPINAKVHAALIEGKKLTNNAYQRHLTFLTRLLDDLDVESISAIFQNINHPHLNQSPKKTAVEKFINGLLISDKEIFSEMLGFYEEIDLQYVRQLGREMQKEQQKIDKIAALEDTKPTKNKYHIRLYQYLFNLKHIQ